MELAMDAVFIIGVDSVGIFRPPIVPHVHAMMPPSRMYQYKDTSRRNTPGGVKPYLTLILTYKFET